jgi:isopentenyl-diphosphate delta-isomerase
MTGAAAEDSVVLVDLKDSEVGLAGKLDAHRRGLTHRAISVFIRNSAGALLMQRRAAGKYHSGGLWANACCSHPLPAENAAAAAQRRLAQEIGIECALQPLFRTHYRAPVSGGLIEDEVVHVFGGRYDGPVKPDPAEVSETRWIGLPELDRDLQARPDQYAPWLHHYMRAHREAIAQWMAGAL